MCVMCAYRCARRTIQRKTVVIDGGLSALRTFITAQMLSVLLESGNAEKTGLKITPLSRRVFLAIMCKHDVIRKTGNT